MVNTKPKVIVFDLGGVVIDWRAGLNTAANLVKINPNELHDFLQTYLADLELGKMSEEDFWKIVADKYNFKGHSHDLANAWVNGQTRIEPSWELVKDLKDSYRLVACTNNWLGVVENQVKNIPEFMYFETIIDSSQEKVKKPDPKMYTLVEERIYEKGNDIFFIDDSQRNIAGAKQHGWQVYLFDMAQDRGQKCAEEIRKLLLTE